MIAGNELRKGNLISDRNNDFVMVIGIDDKITVRTPGRYIQILFESEANPIPLTPEILEASGFAKHGEWFVLTGLSIDVQINISFVHKKTTIGNNEEYEVPHLEYVHDLQNLFFPFHRRELEINF